jgi:molybdenum cofactor cytidylyltransferase
MRSWKPILPFKQTTIVEQVVHTALLQCERVILVTGYRAPELEDIFRGHPSVSLIRNTDWQRGLFSSIQTGVAEVQRPRFFITLGDLPWIGEEIYRVMLSQSHRDVLFPAYGSERGHPVLFGSKVIPSILNADRDTGKMREICGTFDQDILQWKDNSILRDVDTPDDYNPQDSEHIL